MFKSVASIDRPYACPQMIRIERQSVNRITSIAVLALSFLAVYTAIETELQKSNLFYDLASAGLALSTLAAVVAQAFFSKNKNETKPMLPEALPKKNPHEKVMALAASFFFLFASGVLTINPNSDFGLRVPSLLIASGHVTAAIADIALNNKRIYTMAAESMALSYISGIIGALFLNLPSQRGMEIQKEISELLNACRVEPLAHCLKFEEKGLCVPIEFKNNVVTTFNGVPHIKRESLNYSSGTCQELSKIEGLTEGQKALGEEVREYLPQTAANSVMSARFPPVLAPLALQVMNTLDGNITHERRIGKAYVLYTRDACNPKAFFGMPGFSSVIYPPDSLSWDLKIQPYECMPKEYWDMATRYSELIFTSSPTGGNKPLLQATLTSLACVILGLQTCLKQAEPKENDEN